MVNITSPEIDNELSQLSFEYRGEKVSIPRARSLTEFRKLFHSRVLPGQQTMEALIANDEICEKGLAFMYYTYGVDEPENANPQLLEALKILFRQGGLKISDELKKIDPLNPSRLDLTTYLQKQPDDYALLQEFVQHTFIIGPLYAAGSPPLTRSFPIIEDKKFTRAFIPGCVALDGNLIIEGMKHRFNKGRDRIYMKEIVEFIDSMGTPTSTSLIPAPPKSVKAI